MKRIGIRELRQNAGAWLREVEAGATLEITDRGRPVALLTPLPAEEDILERLVKEGRLKKGKGNLLDLWPPVPAKPGVPLPSEILEQMRADER